MRFLSQGDYNFPFTWPLYWAKHVYMWSYQTGTPNPDGFIRLPGRVMNFIVFILFGNLAVSYFYALSTLIIAALAFYLFGRHFLKVQSKMILILGSLFFACNPLFLGNLAKVGLVLAAAMLPLCFVCIQHAFEKRQLRYLLLYIVCLNISLMHPYTFIVNLGASGLYFFWVAWQHRQFVMRNTPRLIGIGIVAILLNLYFILPVVSLGTVSKDVISDNVVPSQTDYTSLVSFSNTGDLFTGLSLAKNVFLDFSFYNDTYQPLYLLGTFGFYALMIAAYLSTEKYLNKQDKRHLAILLGAFLVLVILATTLVFGVNQLIRILITLPGGWAFRSPLKWQLYIPLALFGMMVLLLNNMGDDRRRHYIEAGLIVSFILMNGFLCYDIYKQLLVPRTFTHFAQLANANLDGKTLLYVNSPTCMEFNQNNPRLVTEINQVFVSNNVQVKRVLIDDLATINVGSYDYVLSCADNLQPILEHQYQFTETATFVRGIYRLYTNQDATPSIFTISKIYKLANVTNVGAVYNFASSQDKQPFAFIRGDSSPPSSNIVDIFANLSGSSMRKGLVQTDVGMPAPGNYMLYVHQPESTIYYQQTNSDQLQLSGHGGPGFQVLPARLPITLQTRSTHALHVTYETPTYDYINLINNPSFEEGPWQQQVGDCYAFDSQPKISMYIDKTTHTQGSQSLALSAARHIACTVASTITVIPGAHYLLSFDYASTGVNNAGLNVLFDDASGTAITRRLQASSDTWQHYSEEIVAPREAHHLHLFLYAYPGNNERAIVTHYDAVSFVQIPPLQNIFYLEHSSADQLHTPASIRYYTINPTKKIIHISGATQPFYLASTESYHPLWQLAFSDSNAARDLSLIKQQLTTTEHIRLNGTMNAWYIDPAKLCAEGKCTRNQDGSYDLDLTMQFASQHWFYAGALISSITWLGLISYFGYMLWHDRQEKRSYSLWQ